MRGETPAGTATSSPGLAGTRAVWLAARLGIERNTGATAGAMFLMALGENLWRRFLPKYL